MVSLAICSVESIEECRVDQGAGPDHAARVDEETAEETSYGEPDHLCRQNKEDLVCAAERLIVENALRSDDICRICAGDNHIGHDGDDDMLFDVKWARIQSPGVTKGAEASGREKTLKGSTKG